MGSPRVGSHRAAEPAGWAAAALERKLGMEVRRLERTPPQNQKSQGKAGLEKGQMSTMSVKSGRQNTGCDGPNGMEGGGNRGTVQLPLSNIVSKVTEQDGAVRA